MARIDLTPGPNNYFDPSGQSNQIYGLGGNDQLFGGDESDDLFGGSGNDFLSDDSVDSSDRQYGGDGDDSIFAGFGDSRDLADGGAGIDLISLDYRGFTLGGIRAAIGATMQVRDSSNSRAITVTNCERISIFGTGNSDTLTGGALNDTLNGISGADTIRAGGGSDLVTVGQTGGFGQFQVFGGDGNDTLQFDAAGDTVALLLDVADEMIFTGRLTGTADQFEALIARSGQGDDSLAGGAFGDTFRTEGGDDTVHGRGGHDRIELSDGSGQGYGGDGNDTLSAFGAEGLRVVMNGGTGNDEITGYDAADVISGEAGNDRIFGGSRGVDRLFGGDGNDEIIITSLDAGASAFGGAGNDVVIVGFLALTGTVDGGTGFDRLEIGFNGDFGDDPLRLTVVGTTLEARQTNGTLLDSFSGFERFTITGGSMADTINGGNGADYLTGGRFGQTITDTDVIRGFGGNDTLSGFGADDRVFGGDGNDTIHIGVAQDTVTGGAGRDTFFRQYTSTDDGLANSTRITDFVRGQDRIDLSSHDADLSDADRDAFQFIGRASFTDAGQLRFSTANGVTTIQARTNDNTIVDVHVVLTGTYALTAADFIL